MSKIEIALLRLGQSFGFLSIAGLGCDLRRFCHVRCGRDFSRNCKLSQIYRRNRPRRVGGVRWNKQALSQKICQKFIKFSHNFSEFSANIWWFWLILQNLVKFREKSAQKRRILTRIRKKSLKFRKNYQKCWRNFLKFLSLERCKGLLFL